MCGIIGIVSKDTSNKEQVIRTALNSLAHRGPDAQTLLAKDACIFGHTRLSIVDIATGGQPMESTDKKVAVTFNGEIYGFEEIKKELDYPFQTNSDTEVILAIYKKYGESFIEKLPGMFAFALWDEEKKQLICARDRFGEKPLYYAKTIAGDFIFASEIQTIISTGLVEPIISKKALAHYLSYLYIHPHTTIYTNIHVLPPAHRLIYKNGMINVERYWNLPQTNDHISMKNAVSQFQELLDKSVRDQLVADVPVGAFLSGGLDSTTIVALASKYKKNLKTFSFEFDRDNSELAFAREVAQKYGTDHTELKAGNYNIAELMEEMSSVYDEPFADSSNIPTYIMSKEARKYAKVILTGDGGDEMCGGYFGWYQPLLAYSLRKMHSLSHLYLIKFLRLIHFPYTYKLRQLERGAMLRLKFPTVLEAHESEQRYFSPRELDELGLGHDEIFKRSFLSKPHRGNIDDAIRMDIEDYMPGDILTKIDRASMAHGLELRAPFLDVSFAELCISLPYQFKISNFKDKIILRKAFSHLWPDSIQKRSKKGFGAPVEKWLKIPEVEVLKKEYLENPHSRLFSIISFEKSRRYIVNSSYKTWILLVLALWLEKHPYPIE